MVIGLALVWVLTPVVVLGTRGIKGAHAKCGTLIGPCGVLKITPGVPPVGTGEVGPLGQGSHGKAGSDSLPSTTTEGGVGSTSHRLPTLKKGEGGTYVVWAGLGNLRAQLRT